MPDAPIPNLTIRPAAPGDAGAMAALLNAIIRQGGTTAHEAPFDAEDIRAAYISGPAVICCHVAYDATGRLAGFQALDRHPLLPAGWADIATFVDADLRRSGAGAALFARTRARAEALHLTTLNATIRADNRLGLGYYARMGFRDYATDPTFALRDGTRVGRISKRFAIPRADPAA